MKDYLTEAAIPLPARERLLFILFTGLYLVGFFVFFQPFGVNNYDPQESITPQFLLIVACFGLFAMAVLAVNEFLLFPLLVRDPKRWHMLLWVLWSLLFTASCLFLFYNWLGDWHDWHWSSYLGFIVNVSVMALFPLAGLGFYLKYRALSRTLTMEISRRATTAAPGTGMITFIAENGKDRLILPLDAICLVSADDNYVTIHHLVDGAWRETLFRKSLKSIQEDNLHPDLLRCHRSFMINTHKVVHISGNSRRLQVVLEGRQTTVPISRQYADAVMARFG